MSLSAELYIDHSAQRGLYPSLFEKCSYPLENDLFPRNTQKIKPIQTKLKTNKLKKLYHTQKIATVLY